MLQLQVVMMFLDIRYYTAATTAAVAQHPTSAAAADVISVFSHWFTILGLRSAILPPHGERCNGATEGRGHGGGKDGLGEHR